MSLETLLAQCEDDTREHTNAGAAARLSRWRSYQTEEERAEFIRRMIRKPEGRQNGRTIDLAGGISLESIVLDHEPDSFDDDDKSTAAQTLGRVNV